MHAGDVFVILFYDDRAELSRQNLRTIRSESCLLRSHQRNDTVVQPEVRRLPLSNPLSSNELLSGNRNSARQTTTSTIVGMQIVQSPPFQVRQVALQPRPINLTIQPNTAQSGGSSGHRQAEADPDKAVIGDGR